MYTKAIDLKEFYDSVQGRVVQRILRGHVRRLWPDVKGQRVLGIGYPTPLLRPLLGEAERVVTLMPAAQGAVYWPVETKGLVTLVDDNEWPIETNSVDRIVAMHGMTGHESLQSLLSEAWRVLGGQGRLMLIVPNRTGLWARFDTTPFGHGTPYSMGQIRQLLKDYMFVPEQGDHALFVPPFKSRVMLSTAPLWERAGAKFFGAVGGVNIIEATKQLYAGTAVGVTTAAAIAKRRMVVSTGVNSKTHS